MAEQRKRQTRSSCGRFYGFRVNCECVPLLPASAVRQVWDDPRKIPYLFVWRNQHNGRVKEAVRVTRRSEMASTRDDDWVEIKRPDGNVTPVRLVWQCLPRCSARSLILRCLSCGRVCRALYGARVGDDGRFCVVRGDWQCRACARLRYSSEGRYLCPGVTFGALGNLPRPESWLPYMFASLDNAADFLGKSLQVESGAF
jgi:hypothetical protein